MSVNLRVRPSPIAGLWYEGEPKALARSVDSYLNHAQLPELHGEIIGVVAPHAGHRYSGPVAGYAFAALRGRTPDLVAVLSPFHNVHNAPLLTPAYDAYQTPLGTISIDEAAVQELDTLLRSALGFGLTRLSKDPEHSLEIELPFLQRALRSEWKLLPVMVRAVEPRLSQALGEALARVLQGKNAILVASTDLSHYYSQESALAFDGVMLSKVEAFDPLGAFEAEQTDKGFACGLGALTAVMWACRQLGATEVKILHHATSGDVTGDYSGVVGYGAAAILKSK
ncbi:MAG TPA: AmmeMemoRadiSam system protein B [Anaerolineales bacterium]|nr:AmmeMemoRadiSam system protein B [Anaerolineales bacterium]